MCGELGRGWSLGTGKPYGGCYWEYQAQLVRQNQLGETEEFSLNNTEYKFTAACETPGSVPIAILLPT